MADVKKVVKKNTNLKTNVKKKVAPVAVTGDKAGDFEYKMSRDCAADILRDRKGPEAKMGAQDYLCFYVNEQLGLRGNCVKVIVG